MNIAQTAAGLRPTTAPRQVVVGFLNKCLVAIHEWHDRGRSQVELCNSSDRLLKDIGIAPGEVDRITISSSLGDW